MPKDQKLEAEVLAANEGVSESQVAVNEEAEESGLTDTQRRECKPPSSDG